MGLDVLASLVNLLTLSIFLLLQIGYTYSMKFSLLQTISRYCIVFGIATFLFVGFMGLNSMGTMGSMGQAARCPFSDHSMSICKMNPLEHIQEWQSMFTMVPSKDALSSLLSVLLALLVLLGLKFLRKFSIHDKPRLETYTTPFYLRSNLIFNPLQEAFSNGILNPKIF